MSQQNKKEDDEKVYLTTFPRGNEKPLGAFQIISDTY